IVLWPFGGVAYVSPPQRPGAMLWSIAAGPLVNVALLPILSVFWLGSHFLGWADTLPDVNQFVSSLLQINLILLVFNMLPIYPLDGGQILRSLLWFLFGRANSLMVASVIGLVGVLGLGFFAALMFFGGASGSAIWLGLLVLFIALNCWVGFRQARILLQME